MNKAKRKRLETKGWKVGSVKQFRNPRIPRKLKKRYKKMGIWSAYVFEGKRCKTMTDEQKMTFRVRLEDFEQI